MTLNAPLLKAARALLGWKSLDLAQKSGVAHDTLRAFESGRTKNLAAMNKKAVIDAINAAGLVLIPENGGGAGIRLRDPSSQDDSTPGAIEEIES